jgi:phosphoribosyl 1,2-cyclic phosphate phosphodiesterase
MQLLFLGTAASEGYPNAFCDCNNCTAARRAGGPSLRKRTSALVNTDLLIDLGPDLMAAAQQHGVSLASIHYSLQTHEHHDHFDPTHLHSRSQYCGVYGTPRLHYYASLGALEKASAHFGRRFGPDGHLDDATSEALNLQVQAVQPFDQFQVGPYSVLAVQARHAPELTAMLYVISQAERTLFYCTDTGDLPDESWQALVAYGRVFNVVVMDHTFGIKGRSGGHMNREQFVEQIEKMHSYNLLAADARIYATHIGHHSNPEHEELAAQAMHYGYLVAYDGLAVEV